MKKSLLSVSMLVISITMLALLACSSVANAQNTSKFVYNRGENVETVYTVDQSGKYLTPKVKHETVKKENGNTLKVTYSWDAVTGSWKPCYQLSTVENEMNTTLAYAAWNGKTGAFELDQQKAVYTKGFDGEVLSYAFYKWDQTAGQWDVDQHLLLENYLADYVGGVK